MTKDSRRLPQSTIDADALLRIANILQTYPIGIKVRDLIRELGLSRLTLLKWLHRMEDEGLLYRTYAMGGKRGRPEVLYHLSKDSVRSLSNARGTFVLTGIGNHEGLGRYHILESTADFTKINKSLIELDEKIFASSIVNKTGTLLTRSVRRGYEDRLDLDKETAEKWGAWAAIISAVGEQEGKILSELEYIAIGHKDFKGLIIPFTKLGLMVRLTIEKNTDPINITEMVRKFLNHLVRY
ncbi:MAG: hypothetical protein PXY39_04090 [archaeon]|nr:hypothetical protein [archaeon]